MTRSRARVIAASLCAGLFLAAAQIAVAEPRFLAGAEVTQEGGAVKVALRFNCRVSYLSHSPLNHGSVLRIQIESTGICSGVPPLVAEQRELYRPTHADEANLSEIEYDGRTAAGQVLTLNFGQDVRYSIMSAGPSDTLDVTVYPPDADAEKQQMQQRATLDGTRLRRRDQEPDSRFVVNLQSSTTPFTRAQLAAVDPGAGKSVLQTAVVIENRTWYRTQLGYFESAEAASVAVMGLRDRYPDAWYDRASDDSSTGETALTTGSIPAELNTDRDVVSSAGAPASAAEIDALMADGRLAMTTGELSRAVQIYTKILQMPETEQSPLALEYLGLARERNGQIAHATAEYRRYLAQYPKGDGAARVRQRLAALVSIPVAGERVASTAAGDAARPQRRSNPWVFNTFVSQYYRRDVNQINEEDQIISQSSIFSDINFDARRRGERYDFSSRLSAGYQHDMLGEEGPGNNVRVSYAYVDLADARTGLTGRLGRQNRYTGGVLGRFDGANIEYQVSEKVSLQTAIGIPVYSTSDGFDKERTFYGLSANYGPIGDSLEVGSYFIRRTIAGMTDRQAVGAEMRYFDAGRSLWGMLDYDISYQELGTVFLQGSWQFDSDLTLSAVVDRRRSPFLSTGNALIGQPFESFSDLAATLTEEELRQLSLDRTALSTTYSLSVSKPLTPRLQISADASQTMIGATTESGGVPATPQSTYRYYSTNLLASSLLKEADIYIVGLRMSDSDNTRVLSLVFDTRYPFDNGFRINPRLRIDRREITSDSSTEWIYTPQLRMQYRLGRKGQIEMEAGKQIARRDAAIAELNRDSYFVNFGYQLIFQ